MINALQRLSLNLFVSALVGIVIALLLLFLPTMTLNGAINLYALYLIIIGIGSIVSTRQKKTKNKSLSWWTVVLGLALLLLPLAVPLYLVLYLVAGSVGVFGLISIVTGAKFIGMKQITFGILIIIVGALQISFVVQSIVNPAMAADTLIRVAALLLGAWSSLQFIVAFLSYYSSKRIEQVTGKDDNEIIDIK